MYAWKVTRTWHTWNRNGDYCWYQQPLVDFEQQYSKWRHLTYLWAYFICQFMDIYASPVVLPLASSSMKTSQRRCAWWKSRMKISASSPQTRTWDVFVNLATRASQNTYQVLVHVDDADVILVFRGTIRDTYIWISQQEKLDHGWVGYLYLLWCCW